MSNATADVIIVGGGIVGASIAYQTARRSNLKLLVVEKGRGLGQGSTGGSSAITRQRYTRNEMVRLVKDSNRVFHNWSEYTQIANPRATYHPVGVLWVLGHSETKAAADANRLRSFGVRAKALSSAELTGLFPRSRLAANRSPSSKKTTTARLIHTSSSKNMLGTSNPSLLSKTLRKPRREKALRFDSGQK